MNKDKIKQILNDLYLIDASLKNKEEDLIKIIEKLLNNKPDINIDESFVKKIRSELMVEAKKMNINLKKKGMWENWQYVFGGAVGTALIFLAIINISGINKNKEKFNDANVINEGIVRELPQGAFGRLIGGGQSDKSSSNVPLGLGAGDGAGGQSSGVASERFDALSAPLDSKMIVAPDYVNYNYVYVGDNLPEFGEQSPVYKRIKTNQLGKSAVGSLGDLKLFDVSKFNNLTVDNLNFSEDRDFGYIVYYDFKNGEASINSNYERWPNPFLSCRDDKCYQDQRLEIGDVIKDNEAIEIAGEFLKEYNINLENYGNGEIDKNWQVLYYANIKENIEPYVPDSLTVIYPLLINNEEVLDESGNKIGLRVEVDNRYKKAKGVYNIRINQFESSNYAVETDNEKLIKIAERGGVYPAYHFPEAVKTVDVKLGTPKISLVSIWNFDDNTGVNEELFIPAMVFPVIEKPEEGYFYSNNIIIPLVKDVLDERLNSLDDISQKEPVPFFRGEAVDGDIIESSEILK